ncbi:MAG TPA: hypothetical protein VEQ58_15085, partial [Polyangiaceae bacterium]|nr:hypothetical protein [Polyangiaceae bacterium]
MAVFVVHVGRVLVLVLESVVVMRVRMLTHERRVVRVLVMPVVVTMGMVVIDCFVLVMVTVAFGQVQPQPEPEEDRGERGAQGVAAIAEREAERRADERRDRENRARSRRAEQALGAQVQPQAEAVAR